MNELFLVFYSFLIVASLVIWTRLFVLASEDADYLALTLTGVVAIIPTFAAAILFYKAKVTWDSGYVDKALVAIFIAMECAFLIAASGFVVVAQDGYKYSKGLGYQLVAGPALFWSLAWIAVFRGIGVLTFEVFGTRKMIAFEPQVMFSIFAVIFISEYVGNMRNVEAKMAEVLTFLGGKRTGQSLTEGVNPLPGIMPLMFQVGVYALFRFSIFWGAVRGFVLSPLMFSSAFVAFTSDLKCVAYTISGVVVITDPAKFDDMIDDDASDPRQSMREILPQSLNQAGSAVISALSWRSLVDGSNVGKRILQSTGLSTFGAQLRHVNFVWLGFKEEGLQHLFQEWAGRDLRGLSQNMKATEMRRLVEILRRADPGATQDEAERIWEAFNNGGRGSFKFM